MFIDKSVSPFTPGDTVGIDLFAGRAEQVEELTRYIVQTERGGRQENVFLTGDRGIGKSSFASVVRELAYRRHNMLGIHVLLGGVTTVEELIRRVLEKLINEGLDQPWYEQVSERFGPYISKVGLFGFSVSFQPLQSDLSRIAGRFPEVLGELVTRIAEQYRGVVIVLDDINGLADTNHFARWYKSFVDEISTHYPSYPVLIMLSGLPERRDQLARHEPSLLRIFRLVELDRLTDYDVSDFFERAFTQASMSVSSDAMDTMIHYSSGLPVMMQEIGDATFWLDSDGKVSASDAKTGVVESAYRVGRKYLEPNLFRTLRSPRYHTIVEKLGSSTSHTFTRQGMLSQLTPDEQRVFDNLLRRLREAGVVEQYPEMGRGAYRYTNQVYPVYMYMESQDHTRQSDYWRIQR